MSYFFVTLPYKWLCIFHASVHTYVSSGFPKSVLKYAASEYGTVQRYISLHLVYLKNMRPNVNAIIKCNKTKYARKYCCFSAMGIKIKAKSLLKTSFWKWNLGQICSFVWWEDVKSWEICFIRFIPFFRYGLKVWKAGDFYNKSVN